MVDGGDDGGASGESGGRVTGGSGYGGGGNKVSFPLVQFEALDFAEACTQAILLHCRAVFYRRLTDCYTHR